MSSDRGPRPLLGRPPRLREKGDRSDHSCNGGRHTPRAVTAALRGKGRRHPPSAGSHGLRESPPAAYGRSAASTRTDLFRPEGLTYGDTWRRADARARFLPSGGHGPGNGDALLAANSPECCIAIWRHASAPWPSPWTRTCPPVSTQAIAQSAGAPGPPSRATPSAAALTESRSTPSRREVDPPGDPPQALAEAAETTDPRDLARSCSPRQTTGPRRSSPRPTATSPRGPVLHGPGEYSPADVTLAMQPHYRQRIESTFMSPLLTGADRSAPLLKGPDNNPPALATTGHDLPAAPQMLELFLDATTPRSGAFGPSRSAHQASPPGRAGARAWGSGPCRSGSSRRSTTSSAASAPHQRRGP
jgi:hypothetical protein